MSLKIKLYDSCPDWWDSAVEENDGFFCSTGYWGRFHEKLDVGRGRYLEVTNDGKRIMMVLVYETVIGGNYLLGLPGFILKFIFRLGFLNTFSMHLQPVVCSAEGYSVGVSKEVLQYIYQLNVKEGKNIIPADFLLWEDKKTAEEFCSELKTKFNGLTCEVSATTRLDLVNNADVMYSRLDESVKSGIRKCEKLGVEVKALTCEEISTFYNGLYASWDKRGLAVVPKKYYHALGKLYPKNIKYYVATFNGKTFGGSGVMIFGKTMMEFSMFSSNDSGEKIPAGDVIKWEIIKQGIKEGCTSLDLNMISVDKDAGEKIKNINFYKLKWGGKVVYGVKLVKLSGVLRLIQRLKYIFLGV